MYFFPKHSLFLASPFGSITNGLHLQTLDLKHFCDKNIIIFFVIKRFKMYFSWHFQGLQALNQWLNGQVGLFFIPSFFFFFCSVSLCLSFPGTPSPHVQTRTHSASLRIAPFQCKGEMKFLPIFFCFD